MARFWKLALGGRVVDGDVGIVPERGGQNFRNPHLALKVAEIEAEEGSHDVAAREISVLSQRIRLYARKYRGIAE